MQGNVSLRGDPNVTILVDGKPSSLFQGDNKAQALQSMPADSIERVEVMTNPSAEFSTDGSAGVINLITKKSRASGAPGRCEADGRRRMARFAAGVSLGYNSNKLTVSSDLSARHDKQKQSRLRRSRADPRSRPATFECGRPGSSCGHIIANSFNGRVEPRLRSDAQDARRLRDPWQLHLLPADRANFGRFSRSARRARRRTPSTGRPRYPSEARGGRGERQPAAQKLAGGGELRHQPEPTRGSTTAASAPATPWTRFRPRPTPSTSSASTIICIPSN